MSIWFKIKKFFLSTIFGKIVIPDWDDCTKSSNWTANASQRMMNILSPHMDDGTFKARLKWIKKRGCNCVHLILANKADGECAGYSIYGNKFDFAIDENYANCIKNRIKKIYKEDLGIVLWMITDDSNAWAKTMKSNPAQYFSDVKNLGLFKYASTVVLGLELEEYFNSSSTVSSMISTLRNYYSGKIGTHHVSNKYSLGQHADIVFLQVNPGTSKDAIAAYVKNVKSALNKPVNMFEIERNEDREKSETAMNAGAFGCGNW